MMASALSSHTPWHLGINQQADPWSAWHLLSMQKGDMQLQGRAPSTR